MVVQSLSLKSVKSTEGLSVTFICPMAFPIVKNNDVNGITMKKG